MSNRSEKVPVIVIFICVGVAFAIGAYFLSGSRLKEIEVDASIVPVDVVIFLLTSALAIYLGYYITKKLTEQRTGKDLLISDLSKIEMSINDIEASIKYPGGINIHQLSTIAEGVILYVDRFKRTLSIAGNAMIVTSELETLVYRLYHVATNFDGQAWEVDGIPVGAIRKSATETIVEIRRLVHLINAQ